MRALAILIGLVVAQAFQVGEARAQQCSPLTLTPTEARVVDAYIAYYGRPPDLGGLAFWEGQLNEVQGNLRSIINAFGNSAEFVDRFGSFDGEQLLTNLYQQLFNRNPDSGGLSFWLGRLSSGASTLQEISVQLLDGATGADIITLNGKRAMAVHYIAMQRDGFGFLINAVSQFSLTRDAGVSPTYADQSCAVAQAMKSAWLRGENPVLAYAYNRSDTCPETVDYDLTVGDTPLGTLPPGSRIPLVRPAGVYAFEFLDTVTPRANGFSGSLFESPAGFAWDCDSVGVLQSPDDFSATLLNPDLNGDGVTRCTWGVAAEGGCNAVPAVEGTWAAVGDSTRVSCQVRTGSCDTLTPSDFTATTEGIPASVQRLPLLRDIVELSEGQYAVEVLTIFRRVDRRYQGFYFEPVQLDFTPPNRGQFTLALPQSADIITFVRE